MRSVIGALVATAVCLSSVGTPLDGIYQFSRDPLGFHAVQPGAWPSLAAEDRSAVYLVQGTRRIFLDGPPQIEEISDLSWTLIYQTEDGRPVRIHAEPGPEASVRITIAVEDKSADEKIGIQLRVGAAEGFSGLMERVVQGSQGLSWKPGLEAGLNLRGQTVYLYTLPTVSIYAPFFLSTAGWGFSVDSDWPGTYRFGVDERQYLAPTQITLEQEGPTLELLILPGPTPLEVVRRYARISGLSLRPPEFLLGMGRWRDDLWHLPTFYDGTPYTGPFNTMVVEDVLMMDALGISCTWMVVDRPWAAGNFGYGGLSFDDARLPRFSEMIAWLKDRGIYTLLWISPWVMDEQRDTAVDAGYHVRRTFPYLPQAALIDFTHPQGSAWWIDQLQPLLQTGISGFKLDRGEEKPPDGQIIQGFYHDGTSYREGHNAYPLWFARTAVEVGRRGEIEEFASIYRAGWVGMSSVTAAWGGDTDPSAWGLRSAIIALQRAAILNTPLWGSDTGGYGARPPREVLARWLAFSAFCPIMNVGPMANLAPWAWLADDSHVEMGPEGYPETIYDAELLAIWALYADLRAEIVTYLADLARQAAQDGTPIVQPLFVAFPDRPEWIDAWEQYLLGPDLLLRPVWEPGVDRVDVLLPEGTWIDLWTGTRYVGPREASISVPLHQIPAFLREGGGLVLDGLNDRWRLAQQRTEMPPDLRDWKERMREDT